MFRPQTVVKLAIVVASFLGVLVALLRVLDPTGGALKGPLVARFDKDKDIPGVPGIGLAPQAPEVPAPVASIKKDPTAMKNWHDYAMIAAEKNRTGPGEQGLAVVLSPDEEKLKDALYKVNGFNAYASDKIALNRSLNDIRHAGCLKKLYLEELPTVSVVVPFHNEHWTTLLRTAISVLNRSPAHLIKEIILVDDASTKDFLKEPLDNYLRDNLPKVRVVRSPKRVGLIRARLLGARDATADVLIFLDSHCEATTNWLPPLLDPIARNRRTCVCPFIDVLDHETFEYRAQDNGARGAFDWELFYKRLPLLPNDLTNPTNPFKSPVMAGGLFAIDRKYFWELGGYDEGLDIWGGEQYELSFKIWQCGGEMVDAPCSRVGHVYRKYAPFPNPGIGDFVGRNYRRVAEVWMDEYAEYIYLRRPHYRNIDPGDLSKQKARRRELGCKPFKWFMEEVAFDLIKTYPPVEPTHFAEGEIRSVKGNLCIDTKYKQEGERFGLDVCIKDDSTQGGEQQFALTWHKDIRPKKRNMCFDVSSSDMKAPVVLWTCHGQQGNQLWKYDPDKKWLITWHSRHCLDCDVDRKELFITPCDENKASQQWTFEMVNRTLLAKWKSD